MSQPSFAALAPTYLRFGLIELLRAPGYWLPVIAFPSMLFALIGATVASGTPQRAAVVMASFACYAVLGVGFYQFGVGIAQERESPWEDYLRTLPTWLAPRIVARVLLALLFAAAAVGVLLAIARLMLPLPVSIGALLRLMLVLLGGAVPFSLLGVALGYVVSPKAAVAVANLVYLPLAIVGGLLVPPAALPAGVAGLSPYTPTRQLGDLAWAAVLGRPLPLGSGLALIGYTVLFAAAAAWAYRRNSGRRYR